jgi:DNA-binding protein HU-beta
MADDKVKVVTIPLSKVAAELAEKHEMSKKASTEFLGAFVDLVVKHLKKGNKVRVTGLGILQVRKRPARMGRNPRHRRSHQDQGFEEGCLPRRQRAEGSHLSFRQSDFETAPFTRGRFRF